MDPVLTPYASGTVQHTQALILNSLKNQVSGGFFLVYSPENSDKYLNVSKDFISMGDEESENMGEYYTLDSKIWELLEIKRKTDYRGRIHIGEKCYGRDIRVFVSDIDQDPEKCKSYLLLSKNAFSEVRKTKIKDQIGEPLKVQNNGDIWTTQKDKYVKIFVRT